MTADAPPPPSVSRSGPARSSEAFVERERAFQGGGCEMAAQSTLVKSIPQAIDLAEARVDAHVVRHDRLARLDSPGPTAPPSGPVSYGRTMMEDPSKESPTTVSSAIVAAWLEKGSTMGEPQPSEPSCSHAWSAPNGVSCSR